MVRITAHAEGKRWAAVPCLLLLTVGGDEGIAHIFNATAADAILQLGAVRDISLTSPVFRAAWLRERTWLRLGAGIFCRPDLSVANLLNAPHDPICIAASNDAASATTST